MNVLWDFRLFSYGYAGRGIGRYCQMVAQAVLDADPAMNIFIWGDRKTVPEPLATKEHLRWVDYRKGSWKSSVVVIPYLVARYGIDLIHYWVALGPLHHIGVTPLPLCASVATVYDTGVEMWEVPYLRHVRTTPYWTAQKLFSHRLDGVMAISRSTLDTLGTIISLYRMHTEVVYPPVRFTIPTRRSDVSRQKYFITLGGGVHKNCRNVVEAFKLVHQNHPEHTLRILGMADPAEEMIADLPEGVIHEPSMDQYHEHLIQCCGLIFCSVYEGLGLPPIEALQFGCPLLLSSIPSLRETCGGAALFVDPLSVQGIADGMHTLIIENHFWREKSEEGAVAYADKSGDAVRKCLHLYDEVLERPKKR